MEKTERITGVVEWFASKGQSWGSINYGSNCRCFVHYKNLLADKQADPKYLVLKAGQLVSFEIGPGRFNLGTQALNVKIEGEPGV